MKKEEFFEVLRELDDELVKGAEVPVKRKLNWKALGAVAACLLLIGAFAVHFIFPNSGGVETSLVVGDAAPMIYVNDTLYVQSGDQQSYPEQTDEFVYLGKIESVYPEGEVPKENFQANHPIVGCEVYQYGEDIVVQFNDAYWLYTKYSKPEVNWDELTEWEKQCLDPNYQG